MVTEWFRRKVEGEEELDVERAESEQMRPEVFEGGVPVSDFFEALEVVEKEIDALRRLRGKLNGLFEEKSEVVETSQTWVSHPIDTSASE